MSVLQDDVAQTFLKALIEDKQVEPHVIEQLRPLLCEGSKPKVEQLVRIFTSSPDQEAS